MSNDQLVVEFEFERETKNKVRFSETVDDPQDEVIGKLYIERKAWQSLGEPSKLTVTIAPRSDA